MAKVQVLAVLSLDGCLSESAGDASWVLRPESYNIDKLFGAAEKILTVIWRWKLLELLELPF